MKLFTNLVLLYSIVFSSLPVSAETDAAIEKQKSECASKPSMEWSSTKNRCVMKTESFQKKQDAAACNQIEDLEQRKNCQLNLANQNANLNESAEASLGNLSGGSDKAAMINGASTIISIINMLGSGGENSTCMCKTVLAVTSIGGTITDILMKIKMNKAKEKLIKQYEITKNDSPYLAQYKALQYLKESQEIVKDIADWEVKRQTLLSIGYAAAMATAVYDAWKTPKCADGPPKPAAQPDPNATAQASAPPPGGEAKVEKAPVTPTEQAPVAAAPAAVASTPEQPVSAAPVVAAETPQVAAVAPAPAAVPAATPVSSPQDRIVNYESNGRPYGNAYRTEVIDGKEMVTGVWHGGQSGGQTFYEYKQPKEYIPGNRYSFNSSNSFPNPSVTTVGGQSSSSWFRQNYGKKG